MKSMNQKIEYHVNQLTRKRVRAAIQPGTVQNVFESEVTAVLSDIVNQRLIEDREASLGRQTYQRSDDPRRCNGFKLVSLPGLFSRWTVRKPVLRGKSPAYPLIGLLKRAGVGIIGLLASRFWLHGTSTRAVASDLNDVFGSKLSPSDVSRFTNTLVPDVEAWLRRQIPAGIVYLFVDAIYLPVRKPGFTTSQALLVAIGLTADGKRHVLGFLLGDRENEDSWSALLKDLLARGLDRSSLKLAISDDHKAIRAAVFKTLGVSHQLCVVHKMRNTLVRVAKNDRSAFYADFKAIYWAPSRDEALKAVGRLQARWARLYPKATQSACADVEHFLRFLDQPQNLWTVLRSSNIIERFNRELRRRLNPAGAMHSENELWKLVWAVSTQQENRWDRRRVFYTKNLKKGTQLLAA